MSLFTASAVGMVIANNASLAGAQGGCQAECGSASAMAAAAIVELAGGTPDMIQSAVALSLIHILHFCHSLETDDIGAVQTYGLQFTPDYPCKDKTGQERKGYKNKGRNRQDVF